MFDRQGLARPSAVDFRDIECFDRDTELLCHPAPELFVVGRRFPVVPADTGSVLAEQPDNGGATGGCDEGTTGEIGEIKKHPAAPYLPSP